MESKWLKDLFISELLGVLMLYRWNSVEPGNQREGKVLQFTNKPGKKEKQELNVVLFTIFLNLTKKTFLKKVSSLFE